MARKSPTLRKDDQGPGSMQVEQDEDFTSWLPNELLLAVLQHVSVAELMRARLVCRRWRDVVTSRAAWWGRDLTVGHAAEQDTWWPCPACLRPCPGEWERAGRRQLAALRLAKAVSAQLGSVSFVRCGVRLLVQQDAAGRGLLTPPPARTLRMIVDGDRELEAAHSVLREQCRAGGVLRDLSLVRPVHRGQAARSYAADRLLETVGAYAHLESLVLHGFEGPLHGCALRGPRLRRLSLRGDALVGPLAASLEDVEIVPCVEPLPRADILAQCHRLRRLTCPVLEDMVLLLDTCPLLETLELTPIDGERHCVPAMPYLRGATGRLRRLGVNWTGFRDVLPSVREAATVEMLEAVASSVVGSATTLESLHVALPYLETPEFWPRLAAAALRMDRIELVEVAQSAGIKPFLCRLPRVPVLRMLASRIRVLLLSSHYGHREQEEEARYNADAADFRSDATEPADPATGGGAENDADGVGAAGPAACPEQVPEEEYEYEAWEPPSYLVELPRLAAQYPTFRVSRPRCECERRGRGACALRNTPLFGACLIFH